MLQNFLHSLVWFQSENSSADSIKRYNIAKAGNSHLRRLLIEAAQSYTRGMVGHKSMALKRRQQGCLPEVIAYADKANERLRRKFYRLTLKNNVKRNTATTAVARELACFAWGMNTGNINQTNQAGYRGRALEHSGVRIICDSPLLTLYNYYILIHARRLQDSRRTIDL